MIGTVSKVKKLQQAINLTGDKILYQTKQWYSDNVHAAITKHVICRSVPKADETGYKQVTLFESYSLLQVVFFLLDLYNYRLGKPLSMENETWNQLRGDMNDYIEILKGE